MKTENLELSPREQVNAVGKEISKILSNALKAFGKQDGNIVDFNPGYFRFDITVGVMEYSISVQGRGAEIENYHEAILEIVSEIVCPTI